MSGRAFGLAIRIVQAMDADFTPLRDLHSVGTLNRSKQQ
jgi:hypothetical protein